MRKLKLLIAACALLIGSSAMAQETPENDGVYYMYNEASGLFMTRGENWGTRSVARPVALPWKVSIADGKYTLRMYDITVAGSQNGFGSDCFSDNGTPITFTPAGSATDGFTLQNGENYITCPDNAGNISLSSTASAWKFLTQAQYDAVLAAKVTAQEAAIASEKGITIPTGQTLNDVVSDADNWTVSAMVNDGVPTSSTWTALKHSGRGGNTNWGSYGTEMFQCGNAHYTRTITGLKKGIYKVTVRGMKRMANNANCVTMGNAGFPISDTYLNANGNIIRIKAWYEDRAGAENPNSPSDFVNIVNTGGYITEGFVYVGSDGELVLDASSEAYWGGVWFLFNGISYTYYNNEVSDEDITALVATIPAEGTIPTAVTTILTSLKSTLESQKTIAAYNSLTAAITAANALVAPYAAYKVAAADAPIAGVADATISEQNTAVEEATTVDGINACTTILRTAIAAITTFNITDYTIQNPTAQTKDNWEGTDFGGQSNNVCEYWNKSGADFHQTVNLPAGKYCLTVVALQRTDMTGTVYANGKSTIIAQVSSGIVNNRSQASSWFNDGNGVNTVYFELADATDVIIGLTADATTSDHWTVWKGFKLETFTENVAASYLKPGYDEAMAAAVAYQSVDMFDEDKTTLNNAISDNTVDPATATIAAYESAIANLNAAAAAAAVAVANYTQYNEVVTAIGENTNVDLTSFVTNGDFELNNLNGWTSVDGGNVANNGNFNQTYFVERWKNGVALGSGSLTHDAIVLPAGIYRVTADAQNIEQYNSNSGGTGLFLCANSDQTQIGAKGNYAAYVKLADKESLTIKFLQDNCTGNWIAYDNVTLTYVGADYAYTLVEGKMNADVAAAQTAAKVAFEANQTGANYNALMIAIAAAQASKDAYTAAGQAIADANALKEAHNLASADAIAAFADAIAAIETPYNNNTLATDAANNAGTTLGMTISVWRGNLSGAAVQYMNDGFSITEYVDNSLYVNTWSNEGESDGSNFKVPFYEYFYGEGTPLVEKTWTGTVNSLENGLYSVSAWVRVRTLNGEIAADDATGITMNVNGGTAVDVTEGDVVPVAEGNARFQHKVYTAEGLVKDGILNVNFDIASDNNIHWLTFKNVKYTKVRDLTPEEEAVVPTAIALYNGETEVTEPIALDATNNIVTLTVGYTPSDATEGVTWESSDESVATVVDGVVTGVAPGTATITATSTLDAAVSATATVTVTYPETAALAAYYENDGATRTNYTPGENIIKNGAFEYPNTYYGWTVGTGAAMSAEGFDVLTEEGNTYIKSKKGESGGAVTSIKIGWPIESGKTYVFSYKIKGNAGKSSWTATSLTNTIGTETLLIEREFDVTTEWQEKKYTFTNTDGYAYLQFMARWYDAAYDDFYLAEVTSSTEGNVDYATAAIPTTNIGTGAFQYSQDAIDAANALVQGTATVEEVENAYTALTTLNVPETTQAYNLVFNCEGHTATGNALTLIPNPAQTQGGYGLKYLTPANQNLAQAQAFYFTHTNGNKYKLAAIDQDGATRYITTQAEGYGTTWYDGIRTITEADKAMEVEIRPNGEGLYLLWNTGANKPLAHNGNNNNDLFTNNTANFQFVETNNQASITINTTSAGYGTIILPFAASLPTDVKAYTCAEVEGNQLTLVEATALEANKPYILEGAWNETLTGDAQGAALTYTEGLLTGVYEATAAPVGSYVMQKNNDKVGFYKVAEGKQPTVGANRIYVTVPASESAREAFFLDSTTTGIEAIDALTAGEAQIFNASGAQLPRLQKGMNIVRKADGKSYKVIVK